MMNTYFKNVSTLEELRKQYKELLKIHHPDNGGDVADMQEINSEYDKLFKLLKDKHESKSTETTDKSDYNNMKYDFAEDEKLRDILNKVIHFEDITIEIIGNWVWIGGNTYQYRTEFKELGFKFAGQKKCGTGTAKHFRRRVEKAYQ